MVSPDARCRSDLFMGLGAIRGSRSLGCSPAPSAMKCATTAGPEGKKEPHMTTPEISLPSLCRQSPTTNNKTRTKCAGFEGETWLPQ